MNLVLINKFLWVTYIPEDDPIKGGDEIVMLVRPKSGDTREAVTNIGVYIVYKSSSLMETSDKVIGIKRVHESAINFRNKLLPVV